MWFTLGWKSAEWIWRWVDLWNDLSFSLCSVLSVCHIVATSDDGKKSEMGVSTDWCVAIEHQRSSSIRVIFIDYQTSKWQYPPLRTEPSKSYWVYLKNPMMVPRSTIHKWKRKFFALVSVLLCLSLSTPTFHKTTLRFWKCSSKNITNFIQLVSPQPVDRFSQTKLCWKAPNEGYSHICRMYKSNNKWLRYQNISSCKSFIY